MPATVDIGTLITRSPEMKSNRPRIAGTGVMVMRIVIYYQKGWTPEEIADNWGYISLAQVYAALAYYHANREEIDHNIAEEEALYDRMVAEAGA